MQNYKILLADDDPIITKSIGHVLKLEGYGVTTVAGGQEAITLLDNTDFDLIITDLVMEQLDGIQVLKKAKTLNPDVIVMILTGFGDMISAIDALRLGADDYMLKPCEPEEILHRISRCIEKLEYKRQIRQAREALQESEEKYRAIFNSIRDLVYEISLDHRIASVNLAFEKLTGWAAEHWIGRKTVELIHPEDRRLAIKMFQAFKSEMKVNPVELRILTRSGEYRTIECMPAPLVRKGKLIGILSVGRDVTERKQMETAMLRAEKLRSTGILAGGLAHDFNNLLSVIMGNIELAKGEIHPDTQACINLKQAEKACLNAQELTKQLITFSKGGDPVKKTGSMGDLVKETANLALSGTNMKCEFLVHPDLMPVEFDEGQMKHAINNILVNASESMPNGGTISIEAENLTIDAEPVAENVTLFPGKYVKLSIRDRGVGISEENLCRIFDPYFSTKEMGPQKGMGLGLATAYSIVTKHGGQITVESELGVGTTFAVYLPAFEAGSRDSDFEGQPEPCGAENDLTRKGKILVMDDEEMIRSLSEMMLDRLGYDCETVKNGPEAVERYKAAMDSGKPFTAVILDLTIKGGVGGKQVIKQLQEMDPDVRAVVSSGYANDPVAAEYEKYGFCGFLNKPYIIEDLLQLLKKVLAD